MTISSDTAFSYIPRWLQHRRRTAYCSLTLLNEYQLLIQQAHYMPATRINDYCQVKIRLVINTGTSQLQTTFQTYF